MRVCLIRSPVPPGKTLGEKDIPETIPLLSRTSCCIQIEEVADYSKIRKADPPRSFSSCSSSSVTTPILHPAIRPAASVCLRCKPRAFNWTACRLPNRKTALPSWPPSSPSSESVTPYVQHLALHVPSCYHLYLLPRDPCILT